MRMRYHATRLSDNMHETPEGFLLCTGVSCGRTGDQEYLKHEVPEDIEDVDGKVIVERHPEDVFDARALASFEGKSFTIEHPKNFVGPDNWKDLAHGHIQNVRRGSGEKADHILTDILIKSPRAISLVKNGMRALSFGYEAEYVPVAPGRARQRGIIGNHLALVREGRAGPGFEITDHKGDSFMSKFTKEMGEQFKKMFAQTVDSTVSELEMPAATMAKPLTEVDPAKKDDPSVEAKLADMDAKISQMFEMLKAMAPKETAVDAEPEAPAVEPEAVKTPEERISALEDIVKALVDKVEGTEESEAESDSDETDDGAEVIGDADVEEEEEDVESKTTGDARARAEILAPGVALTKDFKKVSLQTAYKTTDGKAIIDLLSNGQPKFDDKAAVETLFVSASELMKKKRSGDLERNLRGRVSDASATGEIDVKFNFGKGLTPAQANELAEKYFAKKA